MKVKHALMVAGASALLVGLIALGVHQSDAEKALPTPISAGQVVTERSVADALADKHCTFLTKPGDQAGPHIVVLISRTGAMAAASLPASLLADLGAATGGVGEPVGSLTLITVGGAGEQPSVVFNRAALTDPKAGTARAARLAQQLPECITTALDAAAGPLRPGSDELLAEQVAALTADSRIFVVSDGEANTGLLDLRTQGYPHGDPAAAVARVQDAHQVPDFTGREVTYYGIGQNRSEAERSWLTAFYQSLCTAGHGHCSVEKDLVPVSETPTRVVPDDPPLMAITAVAGGPTHTYRVDSASFRAHSTDLVDAPAVTTALRAVVDDATRSGATSLSVYGYACDDGSPTAELVAIAELRAQRIAELLRGQGLALPITAEGRGANDPVAGPQADGTFTSAQCAANRRVEILIN